MFDDDVALQRELKTINFSDPEARSAQTRRFAAWAGAEPGPRALDRFRSRCPGQGATFARGSCEVSATLGRGWDSLDGAIVALDEVYERYDGQRLSRRAAGEEMTIAARLVHVAEQAVIAHYEGGIAAAVRARRPPRPAASSTRTSAPASTGTASPC